MTAKSLWYDPAGATLFETDNPAAARASGALPVAIEPEPTLPPTQRAVRSAITIVAGVAVLGWAVEDLPLGEARAAIMADADRIAKGKRDGVVAAISPAEMASWPIKRAEALAYDALGVNATDADAPLLAVEAQARGCSTAALVARVLAKANTLSALEAAIAGHCGAIQDQANAAATLADLAAIDVNDGWPV